MPKSQVETTRAVDTFDTVAAGHAASLPPHVSIEAETPSTEALRKRRRSVIACFSHENKKTPHHVQGFILHDNGCGGSARSFDRRSLGVLRALGHFELYALAFLQAAEALGVDCREMNEHICRAVLRCDETETLGVVESFDRTETHCANLWIHGVGAPDLC